MKKGLKVFLTAANVFSAGGHVQQRMMKKLRLKKQKKK